MIFLVPARSGSKRLVGKNKRQFCGLPLYLWSVATANRVKKISDNLLVATDDIGILDQRDLPCVRRPDSTCTDDSPTQDLVTWIMEVFGADDVVLLQPTSPTRPDSLVRQLIAHGGQVRSVTNGAPNGQCWVYRKGHEGWIDIETEKGWDIDVLSDFQAAEQDMMRRFA